jgi:hypothetical protein
VLPVMRTNEVLAASSAVCTAPVRCGSRLTSRTRLADHATNGWFDVDGRLIVPLNEWYRLMEGVGAARTRETYLAVLRPWFGFMAQHHH